MESEYHVVITGSSYDLSAKRSIVSFTWENIPEKRLWLDVPFGCSLEALQQEAEAAPRRFAAEFLA